MIKPNIAIDLDEVITEHLEKLLEFYNQKFKTNFKKDDFFTYDFWEVWGGTRAQAEKITQEFYNSPDFDQTQPVTGAVEGIKKLTQGFEIYIITSRPPQWQEKTNKWLKKYLDNIYQQVIYSGSQVIHGQTKPASCQKFKIKIILEDRKEYSLDCAENNIQVILFTKSWNINFKAHKNIIRVDSWPQALDKISQINQ